MRAIATILLTALALAIVPAERPALADGAASTRNLLFLGAAAAATYLIIKHNHDVHAREAAMAARQAQTAEQRNEAWAAYDAERHAYLVALADNRALEHEVAYQHRVIQRARHAIATSSGISTPTEGFVGPPPSIVANLGDVSYGWGNV
jgi:hypothetical protein